MERHIYRYLLSDLLVFGLLSSVDKNVSLVIVLVSVQKSQGIYAQFRYSRFQGCRSSIVLHVS